MVITQQFFPIHRITCGCIPEFAPAGHHVVKLVVHAGVERRLKLAYSEHVQLLAVTRSSKQRPQKIGTSRFYAINVGDQQSDLLSDFLHPCGISPAIKDGQLFGKPGLVLCYGCPRSDHTLSRHI